MHSLEDLGMFPKEVNIEHLLRIIQLIPPLRLKLRVQPTRRPEIGYTATRGDARSGKDDDLSGVSQQFDGLRDSVEIGKLLASTEDAGERDSGERKERQVWSGGVTKMSWLIRYQSLQ